MGEHSDPILAEIRRLREDEAALVEVRAALRTPPGADVVRSAIAVRALADKLLRSNNETSGAVCERCNTEAFYEFVNGIGLCGRCSGAWK